MSKLLSSLLMAAAVAGFAAVGGPAPAQDKKDTKKDAKDAKDAKATKAGTVEVNEGKDGKYRFNVRDADGKLLAMSGLTGFATRDDAVKALENLKAVLPTAKVAEAKEAKKDDKAKDAKKDDKK